MKSRIRISKAEAIDWVDGVDADGDMGGETKNDIIKNYLAYIENRIWMHFEIAVTAELAEDIPVGHYEIVPGANTNVETIRGAFRYSCEEAESWICL